MLAHIYAVTSYIHYDVKVDCGFSFSTLKIFILVSPCELTVVIVHPKPLSNNNYARMYTSV